MRALDNLINIVYCYPSGSKPTGSFPASLTSEKPKKCITTQPFPSLPKRIKASPNSLILLLVHQTPQPAPTILCSLSSWNGGHGEKAAELAFWAALLWSSTSSLSNQLSRTRSAAVAVRELRACTILHATQFFVPLQFLLYSGNSAPSWIWTVLFMTGTGSTKLEKSPGLCINALTRGIVLLSRDSHHWRQDHASSTFCVCNRHI